MSSETIDNNRNQPGVGSSGQVVSQPDLTDRASAERRGAEQEEDIPGRVDMGKALRRQGVWVAVEGSSGLNSWNLTTGGTSVTMAVGPGEQFQFDPLEQWAARSRD